MLSIYAIRTKDNKEFYVLANEFSEAIDIFNKAVDRSVSARKHLYVAEEIRIFTHEVALMTDNSLRLSEADSRFICESTLKKTTYRTEFGSKPL